MNKFKLTAKNSINIPPKDVLFFDTNGLSIILNLLRYKRKKKYLVQNAAGLQML